MQREMIQLGTAPVVTLQRLYIATPKHEYQMKHSHECHAALAFKADRPPPITPTCSDKCKVNASHVIVNQLVRDSLSADEMLQLEEMVEVGGFSASTDLLKRAINACKLTTSSMEQPPQPPS